MTGPWLTRRVLVLVQSRELPDVILIRKTYPARTNRARSRAYKLKQLPKEQGEALRRNEAKREEAEYEEFLKDVDEDPEMRSQMNLYKRDGVSAVPDVCQWCFLPLVPRDSCSVYRDPQVQMTAADHPSAADADMKDEDDGFPVVQLDELLDDLAIT